MNMVRDDNQAELSLSPSDSCEFPVILGGLTSYIAYFDSFVPNKIAVYGRGIKKYSISLESVVDCYAWFVVHYIGMVPEVR